MNRFYTMLVWWRVFDPPCTGPFGSAQGRLRPVTTRATISGCIHGNESLCDALLQRPVSADRRLRIRDGLEARFHFQVERERPVARGMRGVGFEIETAAG